MTRDDLITQHLHLVPITRQRCYPVPPVRIAAEDLESEGYIGLVKAADRFDPARGTAFRSFAIAYIRGAMRDFLRREDWVPRPTRERLEETGEEPYQLLSLDEILLSAEYEQERRRIETLSDPIPLPAEQVEAQWEITRLQRMVHWLPMRERQVLWWTDALGHPNEAVAARLRVSASRVQQIRQRARLRLRRFLAGVVG